SSVLKPSRPSCNDAKSPGVITPERSLGEPMAESGLETFVSVPSKNFSKSISFSKDEGYAMPQG
ncbi:hypothetical protein GP486_002760, partial [Trichoglossum hirsutum]